jgi:hypothetical protein
MDALLSSLETLIDEAADPAYEVEYSVRQLAVLSTGANVFLERCLNPEAWRDWYIRDKQATAQ